MRELFELRTIYNCQDTIIFLQDTHSFQLRDCSVEVRTRNTDIMCQITLTGTYIDLSTVCRPDSNLVHQSYNRRRGPRANNTTCILDYK